MSTVALGAGGGDSTSLLDADKYRAPAHVAGTRPGRAQVLGGGQDDENRVTPGNPRLGTRLQQIK
jgi:hypothetical protein